MLPGRPSSRGGEAAQLLAEQRCTQAQHYVSHTFLRFFWRGIDTAPCKPVAGEVVTVGCAHAPAAAPSRHPPLTAALAGTRERTFAGYLLICEDPGSACGAVGFMHIGGVIKDGGDHLSPHDGLGRERAHRHALQRAAELHVLGRRHPGVRLQRSLHLLRWGGSGAVPPPWVTLARSLGVRLAAAQGYAPAALNSHYGAWRARRGPASRWRCRTSTSSASSRRQRRGPLGRGALGHSSGAAWAQQRSGQGEAAEQAQRCRLLHGVHPQE